MTGKGESNVPSIPAPHPVVCCLHYSAFCTASDRKLGGAWKQDFCSCVLYSTWAVLSPEQLEKTLTNWRKTIDEGKADDFIGKCEEHRMRIGCSTSAVGYK